MIFVPAALSPHKLDRTPGAPGEVRLEMLRAAVASEGGIFEVDPCELDRAGPSYTVDTARALHARLPGAELHYLIGADNVAELPTWHRIDELRTLVRFVVFHRRVPGAAGPRSTSLPALDRVLDLSSTEIRNRVASGRSIRYLVPETVAAVIDARSLYRNPPQGGPPSLPPKKSSRSVRSTPPKRKP